MDCLDFGDDYGNLARFLLMLVVVKGVYLSSQDRESINEMVTGI